MRKLIATAFFAVMSMAASVQAQTTTVVELYTSQGCSSCPPADAFLHELAKQDDVIALALHVDYWDYIGWKDEFASPAYTERQKAYARVAGSRTVYTPQMVIGGVDHVVGTRPEQVAAKLTEHMMKEASVDLTATRDGDKATVMIGAVPGATEAMVVQLVTYNPSATVDIKRGENAGKTLTYANVVTSWTALDAWNGKSPLTLTADIPNGEPAVIIVQRQGPGAIMAAAKVE
ncbi:DUF1223 domain-containing protein [Shimia ponticola]|uniref:DUF1223 domain-containing protein n=1 Tax=Shimia ponticola TaxID=2582893 RepID=UPI0011BE651E|nr:DUF1223 domain-containing protein [Shimia ponticola]